MAKSTGQKRRREAEADLEHQGAATKTQDGPPSKKSRVEERRSLFVRSLPPSATAESLTDFFSQHFPVKHATVVVDPRTKESRGYGFVTFTDADDAVEAKQKLNNELLGGRRMKLEVAEPRHRAGGESTAKSHIAEEKKKREEEMAEARKAPKLIIRNLPWSIKSSEQLTKTFSKYGKIKFADLPNNKGKLKGFGFVTFRSKKHAERAMQEMNGKDVDGRTIAVDWAVSKDEWQQQQGLDVDEEGEDEPKPKIKKSKKEKADEDDDDDEKMKDMTEEDRDLATFMRTMEDFESEDEDDEEGGGDLDEDDDERDEDEDEEFSSDAEETEEEKPKRLTDNSTTVFIRNLPFTATDDSLKEHFTKFGHIRYARIVKDRATERPAGTGFVCFVNEDDFKACVKNAPRQRQPVKTSRHSVLQDETIDTDGRYTLDGRVLSVAHAVSKEESARLTEAGPAARKGQEKDKRRLYLLSEGTIPSGSPLYKLLSPTEVKLREQSLQQRKKQVQSNPSLHLSMTRLAIRNLPRNMSSKELKQLARQAIVGFSADLKAGKRTPLSKEELARGGAEDREAEHRRKEKGVGVVKQAKVVFETRDGKKVDESTGAGLSRGYGFIEYSSHRWALMGLRWLNGHALKNEAGRTVRLIVEFAIENAQVVSRRRANEVRARTKRAEAQDKGEQDKKQGRKDVKGKAGKAGKASVDAEGSEGEGEASTKKDAKEKLAQRQRIIGRKRMARKNKGRKG
ncbi:putative nucleolar protein 4 [Diaporthe ampelina]|uniref:Putative nucleolar protein 4 n=1 Tax=Diaporthe ampelina TaxID=1214573 RepID=A0A0G2FWU6_9PEZI|nr:putative nucleolar protein 4 [Diaporthe ampelina]